MSWSHPPLSRTGSRCHYQITLGSALELGLLPWPPKSPGGLPRVQELGTRGGSTGTFGGWVGGGEAFKKDVITVFLSLEVFWATFPKKNGCI